MGTGDLRLIKVDVPPNALLGGSARLRCRFKLGNTALYSVKWYKEDQEFFRYVPGDHPPKNVFPLKDVTVNVGTSTIRSFRTTYAILARGSAKFSACINARHAREF